MQVGDFILFANDASSLDTVKRLHIIDGCQMLDLPSAYKYERNFGSGPDVENIREGASFPKLFETANLCEVPATAKLNFLTGRSIRL